jgi:hypothetical protein
MKWEELIRQRGANFIGSELKNGIKENLPKINIITCGGTKIRVDANSQSKIQKASPKDDKYDPLKQKLFFKDAIEIFKSIPTPKIVDNSPKFTFQPKLVQAPTSPWHLETL